MRLGLEYMQYLVWKHAVLRMETFTKSVCTPRNQRLPLEYIRYNVWKHLLIGYHAELLGTLLNWGRQVI